MSSVQTTTLNRPWVLKMVAFIVILAGFGTWGLIDGLWVFPNRGEKDASYKLYVYLQAARDAGRLTQANVGVPDPAASLAELEAKERDLRTVVQGKPTTGGISPRAAAFELARLDWLRSLQRIWRLDSAPGRLQDDLAAQLDALTTTWKTTTPPKPLDTYDLHFQWIFVVLGYAGALWLVGVLARAKGTVFRWDPAEHRLTLPDGASMTPADVAEFDKRKWHKFYVTLVLKDGSSRTLDLLRYVPLEAWILEMEKIAFPSSSEGEAAPEGSPEPQQGAAAEPLAVGESEEEPGRENP